MKLAFIGAGSVVFGEQLLTDIITFPSIQKNTVIYLEDIDKNRLNLMYRLMMRYKELYPQRLEGLIFEKTTDLKKAIVDAKYIICAIHVGGLDAFKIDLDIPLKYGISQCVGDSLGPGGVFRFLRQSNILKEIVELIRDVGYNSGKNEGKPYLFNYANPMAMNSWYCNLVVSDSTIGLCHGIQETAGMLRNWIGVKPQDFSYLCAGINHMAWFLELWYRNPNRLDSKWEDAYPLIIEAYNKNPSLIGGELLRWDMMEATGYFMTESTGHLSEYLPYYRKKRELLNKFKGSEGGFNSLLHGVTYRADSVASERLDSQIEKKINRKKLKWKKQPSDEYVSHIINAMETDKPFRFNGNILNKDQGLITNLPRDCCVEVPIFADYHGIHPQGGIKLPTVCQALNISNIMVQKAAVEAQINLDREKVYHAVLLDPNTASVCSPSEIRDMVDELFEAEKVWLPQFKNS